MLVVLVLVLVLLVVMAMVLLLVLLVLWVHQIQGQCTWGSALACQGSQVVDQQCGLHLHLQLACGGSAEHTAGLPASWGRELPAGAGTGSTGTGAVQCRRLEEGLSPVTAAPAAAAGSTATTAELANKLRYGAVAPM